MHAHCSSTVAVWLPVRAIVSVIERDFIVAHCASAKEDVLVMTVKHDLTFVSKHGCFNGYIIVSSIQTSILNYLDNNVFKQ